MDVVGHLVKVIMLKITCQYVFFTLHFLDTTFSSTIFLMCIFKEFLAITSAPILTAEGRNTTCLNNISRCFPHLLPIRPPSSRCGQVGQKGWVLVGDVMQASAEP